MHSELEAKSGTSNRLQVPICWKTGQRQENMQLVGANREKRRAVILHVLCDIISLVEFIQGKGRGCSLLSEMSIKNLVYLTFPLERLPSIGNILTTTM